MSHFFLNTRKLSRMMGYHIHYFIFTISGRKSTKCLHGILMRVNLVNVQFFSQFAFNCPLNTHLLFHDMYTMHCSFTYSEFFQISISNIFRYIKIGLFWGLKPCSMSWIWLLDRKASFHLLHLSSSTSAYMLMYRRIDREKNAHFLQPSEFPESLKLELQQQKDQEEKERRQREIDRSTCKIKVYLIHPIDQQKRDIRLEIHKGGYLLLQKWIFKRENASLPE